jgi:hypothetical protein
MKCVLFSSCISFVFVCNVFWVEFQRYCGGGGDGVGGGHIMTSIPHRILWCYGEYQTLYGTLDGVDFQHGWPDLDKYIYL